LSQFREKHDVCYIVAKTLSKLKQGRIYEKQDVVKLTGLRQAYPGLSQELENSTEYKGRAGGVSYWGHPIDIKELKNEGIMV
jgi:hypothetical protein